MIKKDFTNLSQAEMLIGRQPEETKEEIKEAVTIPEEEGTQEIIKEAKMKKAPKGYKINPLYIETKSQRVQILARPSTMQKIKRLARGKRLSTNEMINRILESYLENIED